MNKIKSLLSLLLFLLNPFTWIYWNKSKDRIQNEFYWIWLKVTTFYLHQVRYPKILKRIQKKYKSNKTISIGFIVIDTSKWSIDSIYNDFTNNSRFDTTLFIFPDPQFPGGSAESVRFTHHFFETKGYHCQYGYNPDTNQYADISLYRDTDIIFFDTPWLHPQTVMHIDKIGRHCLTCYVPYSFIAAGGRVQSHYRMPSHSFAWKIFAETSWHVSQFLQESPTGGKNAISFGFPKLDTYTQPVRNPANVWKSGLDSLRKRVIWAPHWTILTNSTEQWSSFHLIYKEMLEYAKLHCEIDWLFKPHPVLYATIIKSGLMSENEAKQYYQSWENLPNCQACYSGDFWDYFKTSDALLTDSVSFLVEYLPTEKPIFHIASSQLVSNEQYNELVNLMVATYYSGSTMADIDMFIQQVIIENNDYKKEERLAMIDNLPNIGTSGHLISQYIENYCKGIIDDKRKN